MAPDLSARMLQRASCDLEEGEVSPTPPAAPIAAPMNSGISALEAEALGDGVANDFFDAVAAHQAEQIPHDAHINRGIHSLSPVSGPDTPGVVSKKYHREEPVQEPSKGLSPSGASMGASPHPPTSSSPTGWASREIVAHDGEGAQLGPPQTSEGNETPDGRHPGSSPRVCFPPEETDESPGARGPPMSVRYLLSPSGSILGMLQQQQEEQQQQEGYQQRQQEDTTKSKGLLPLNLQKAHQQRMQTLDIQRGTEVWDDSLEIGLGSRVYMQSPHDDLMQHLQRLSTKIRAQEDEKRVMAEESFQLEQILKRQYHADIKEKTEQNKQLLQINETLKQQLEKLTGECEGMRGVFAVMDEVLEGFFARQMRSSLTLQTEEEAMTPLHQDGNLGADLNSLFASLNAAFDAESATLDEQTEKELQERLEAAATLCRAAIAGAAAAASLSPTAGTGPSSTVHPSSSPPEAPLTPAVLGASPEAVPAAEAEAPKEEKGVEAPPVGPLKPLGSPPSSSEAQLETLKAQIERLRENLGAFTEGVLHAHKRHLRTYKPQRAPKPEGPPEKLEASKPLDKNLPEGPFSGPPLPAEEPQAMDQSYVGAAAKGPLQPSEPWLQGGPPKAKAKARTLWGNSAMAGGPSGSVRSPLQQQQLQQPLLPEPVRGAVLLPVGGHRQQQKQQQERLRCSPCVSGSPFDLCCEGPGAGASFHVPPKAGIILPPLRQRQRQGSKGPCARRRGPSGGPASQLSAAGSGLTVSASAATLLPALKPTAAIAAGGSSSSKGLMGSASAVDLSVIGRPLGVPLRPATRPLPLYRGPPYGVFPYTQGAAPPCRPQERAVSPSGNDRGQWGATARSNSSSSSGRVFSRTRRSCSPIRERAALRAPTGALGGAPHSGGGARGRASQRQGTVDVLSLESKVSPSGTEARKGDATRPPLLMREECGPPRPWALGGPQGVYPAQGTPPAYAATPPRELSPISKRPGEFWGEEAKGAGMGVYYNGGMWPPTNTRLVAPAPYQEAATAAAARLVAPSSGAYMQAYSQPPRPGGLTAVLQRNPSLMNLQGQQQRRQPSPFAFSPLSPAATAPGPGGYFPSAVNARSPIQYRFISPANADCAPLSTVSSSHGCALRAPTPGTLGGASCGGCGLLSPMCYSNPPMKSPSSSRSSSNVHSIQRQRHKAEEGGEWMPPRP